MPAYYMICHTGGLRKKAQAKERVSTMGAVIHLFRELGQHDGTRPQSLTYLAIHCQPDVMYLFIDVLTKLASNLAIAMDAYTAQTLKPRHD